MEKTKRSTLHLTFSTDHKSTFVLYTMRDISQGFSEKKCLFIQLIPFDIGYVDAPPNAFLLLYFRIFLRQKKSYKPICLTQQKK